MVLLTVLNISPVQVKAELAVVGISETWFTEEIKNNNKISILTYLCSVLFVTWKTGAYFLTQLLEKIVFFNTSDMYEEIIKYIFYFFMK